MNISLEEYEEFAKKIGFRMSKVGSSFVYIEPASGIVLPPFMIGRLCQLTHIFGIEEANKTLNEIQRQCMSKSMTLKELPKTLKEEVENQKLRLHDIELKYGKKEETVKPWEKRSFIAENSE